MNEAQKIAKTVTDTVTKQSDEVIDLLKQKGFEGITVHFGHSETDEGERKPYRKNHFSIYIHAHVNIPESDGQ